MNEPSRRPTTDFGIIEQDKENIQTLAKGRSASALSTTFSIPLPDKKRILNEKRQTFEASLNETEDLDDPIQPYLDYLQWIHNSFPMGSNVESGLIPLLERCTHDFRDDEYYKNEVRYLKVWIEYVKYCDSPRDVFVYLFKKKIGSQLALFYEEFSKFLESQNDYEGAESILKQGIEKKARPLKRLVAFENSFKVRRQNSSIDNQGPRGLRNGRQVLGLLSDSSAISRASSAQELPKHQDKKPKVEIFRDVSTQELSLNNHLEENPGFWNQLESINSRKKENTMRPLSWKGETIPMNKQVQARIDGSHGMKIQVFRDDSLTFPVTKTIHNPGKKSDKLNFNLDLLYPQEGEPISHLELLSMSLGVYSKKKSDENDRKRKRPSTPITTRTSIVQLNDENKRHSRAPASPTLTFFSKMASKDINELINGSLHENDYQLQNYDYENSADAGLSDFVTETITQPLKDDNDNSDKEPVAFREEKEDKAGEEDHEDLLKRSQESNGVYRDDDAYEENTNTTQNSNIFLSRPMLTPIHERSERPEPEDDDIDDILSSPFQDRVRLNDITVMPPPKHDSILINPMDDNFKKGLLAKLSLISYPNFKTYNYSLNKLSNLKRIFNKKRMSLPPSSIGKLDSVIELDSDLYCIKKELGEGGYATVYLAEKSNGELKAIKLEQPANIWEFYILKQIERRTNNLSFIYAESLYAFKDEGCLILKYFHQGTVLDLVNIAKDQGKESIEESLAIFLCYELLSKIEILHEIGIIHGDLKPDNCMLNFSSETSELQLTPSHFSTVLIDYGRAIDMTLLPSNVKFICDWKTDKQDCPEMRKKQPWTYECDYYGVASIMHTILFGRYIDIKDLNSQRYCISSPFKRYWNKDMWSEIFDTLLNPKSYGILPINDKINSLRLSLKNWLTINARNSQFKAMIRSYELDLNEINKRPKRL